MISLIKLTNSRWVPLWVPLTVVIGILAIGSDYAYAEGCDDYPFSAGEISYEETPTGPKILATGVASVDFDDNDEVIDATQEATMEAKAVISKFFSETIQSDESIETASLKTIKIVKGPEGDQKAVTKDKVKLTLKRLASHSEALLRGVITLAQCYSKGDRVMVSVGLKPETIAAAETLTGAIGASVAKQPTTTEATVEESTSAGTDSKSTSAGTDSTGTTSQQGVTTEGPESYSKGTEKLKNF